MILARAARRATDRGRLLPDRHRNGRVSAPTAGWADPEDHKRDVDSAVDRLRAELAESSAAFTAAAMQVQEAGQLSPMRSTRRSLPRRSSSWRKPRTPPQPPNRGSGNGSEQKAERELEPS